jgi:hypothetical protein
MRDRPSALTSVPMDSRSTPPIAARARVDSASEDRAKQPLWTAKR